MLRRSADEGDRPVQVPAAPQPHGLPPTARAAPGPAPRRAPDALALGAVLLVVAAFFAPAILGGGDFIYRDTGRMHAPMKQWIGEELAHGRFPQWNPYAGLGTPVVAAAQDGLQHPFTALLLALPTAAAMKAWILLSYALAAAGAFVWGRALGVRDGAAAVAALAFALSGPLVSASDNVTFLTTFAALPWLLAAAHGYAARGGPVRLLGVGAASALCAAAGDPQAWAFGVGLAPVLAVAFAAPGRRLLAARRGLATVGAAVVASAPFVLPIVAWVPHSGRAAGLAAGERELWNLHPRRLLELVLPDLLRDDPNDPVSVVFDAYGGSDAAAVPWFLSVYLGAAVVALAAAAAARCRRARVLVAAAALFGWAALGHHAGFAWLAARLPVLHAFRYWEKLAVWLPLLLAPAAAIGADGLARGVGARVVARAASVGAIVLLALAALAALAPSAIAAWAGGSADAATRLAANVASGAGRAGLVLALLAAVATLVGRGRLSRRAPLAVGAVVALDLFGGNAGAYVLGPPERNAPPPLATAVGPGGRVLAPFAVREDRWPELGRLGSTWEWARRTLAPSWNVPLRVGTDHDYVGLRAARWVRLLDALEASGRVARLGLFGFSHVVVPRSPDLAARAGVAPPFRVAAIDPELPALLVEIPHRPRAYLATAPFEATDAEAFAFAVGGGEDGRTAVEASLAPGRAARGEAEIARDLPGDTAVRVRADGPALLVLNDLFAPGWTATVDGRPAAILRANALVRAVAVEPGAHEVRFRYCAPGLRAGWALALAGALALAAWALARRRAARGVRES
jgi:hypothetical protein